MKSPKFYLIKNDIKSWGKIALLFLAPVFVLYISFVISNSKIDGFAWSDFIPNLFIQGVMVVYILNEALALVKKYIEENKYNK